MDEGGEWEGGCRLAPMSLPAFGDQEIEQVWEKMVTPGPQTG